MVVSKALDRIFWRFGGKGNKNPFKVNQADVDAFNSLSDYVKETQKKIVQHNQLFSKLYVYMVMKIMEQKGSTVYDNIARKQIGNVLKMPLSQLIEMLTESMNESELYGRFEELGVIQKHPALRTDDENAHNTQVLEKATADILDKPWSYEDVEPAIIAEINQMIELHK